MIRESLLPTVVGEAAPATITTDIAVGVFVAVVLFALYYKLILLRAKRGNSPETANDGGTSRRDTGN